MKAFEYVTKKEYGPIKNDLVELINMVQDEVRHYFTFRYDFIGSAERNMITREINGNKGFDFDVNLRVNDPEENFLPQDIRNILKKGFDKFCKYFDYDYTEDSSRVLTIKVKDKNNSRIVHSCDFAVVFDCDDGRQQIIVFNKAQNSYDWAFQPLEYYQQAAKIKDIKDEGLWQEVRDLYLMNKCKNNDFKKKSRAIFAETINQIYDRYF